MNKFVFWWDSPCRGMIGVLRDFCTHFSPDSVVITGTTGNMRKQMGWQEQNKLFAQHIIVQQENWKEKTNEFFNKYQDGYIHVFNGITRPIFWHLVTKAYKSNVRYGFITEAYSNLFFGYKRILKSLYLSLFLPIITRKIAKRAKFIFCLSGKKKKNIDQLRHIGFSKKKIIPFGYWTDDEKSTSNSVRQSDYLNIICPGLLVKYKGVDVLLKAIKILKERKNINLICHITGNGNMIKKLEMMCNLFDINDMVVFHGVLQQQEYDELVSKTDILVAPGYIEPWGIRVNESIQREQPVICSDGLGASDLIEESGTGFVFHSGNYRELADCIAVYVNNNTKLQEDKIRCRLYKSSISCGNKAKEMFNTINEINV